MRIQYLLFACLPIMAACDADSFSQTVDIPFPEHEPLPALSLNLRSGDSVAYALLNISRGILDEPIENDSRMATTELYRDDVLIGTRSYPLGQTTGTFETSMNLTERIREEEATYRLVGKIDGFPDAVATQVMPDAAMFSEVEYTRDGALDNEGFRVDEITLKLEDPGETTDYYAFQVSTPGQSCTFNETTMTQECTNDFTQFYSVYVTSPDPLLIEGLDFGLLLTDQSFNGGTFTVRFFADSFDDGDQFLEVYRISEDAYRYARSFAAYIEAGDNPFAEPVQVHGNVENGYGAFVTTNVQRVLLNR